MARISHILIVQTHAKEIDIVGSNLAFLQAIKRRAGADGVIKESDIYENLGVFYRSGGISDKLAGFVRDGSIQRHEGEETTYTITEEGLGRERALQERLVELLRDLSKNATPVIIKGFTHKD